MSQIDPDQDLNPQGEPGEVSAPPRGFQQTSTRRGGGKPLLVIGVLLAIILIGGGAAYYVFYSQYSPLPKTTARFLPESKFIPDSQQNMSRTNIQSLLKDRQLESASEAFLERWEVLEDLGIFIDEAETLTFSGGGSGTLLHITGGLDYEDIQDELYSADFDDARYRGTEVWTGRWNSLGQTVAVSFIGGDQLLVGWPGNDLVRDAIRVKETGRGSFGDEKAVEGIIGILPDGLSYYLDSSCGRWRFRDCEAWGRSMTSQDEFTVVWTWVFGFRKEREARFNVDEVNDAFERSEPQPDLFDIQVGQRGRHIVVKAAQDKEDTRAVE